MGRRASGRPWYADHGHDGSSLEYLAKLQAELAAAPTPPPAPPPKCNRCASRLALAGMAWCAPCAIKAHQPPAGGETPEEAAAREARLKYFEARAAEQG